MWESHQKKKTFLLLTSLSSCEPFSSTSLSLYLHVLNKLPFVVITFISFSNPTPNLLLSSRNLVLLHFWWRCRVAIELPFQNPSNFHFSFVGLAPFDYQDRKIPLNLSLYLSTSKSRLKSVESTKNV